MTDKTITKCPICGGELQATMEQYTKGVQLDLKGNVVNWGKDAGIGQESRWYCENDHTSAHIQYLIENPITKDELEEALEQAICSDSPRSMIHIEDVIAGKERPDDWLVEQILDERSMKSNGV